MVEGGARIDTETNKRPKLSIITVVYNAAALLPGYFENVSPYLNEDIELVILDGASTDHTPDLLHQHEHLITYWHSEPDAGIYDAMNKATKFAKGRWLYFMGADDRLLGGFTGAVAQLSDVHTIYHGKAVVWGEIWGKPFTKYGFTKMDICHQSVFYPAEVFDHYQYDAKYTVYADQHLNLGCVADKRFKWQFINRLMAIYDARGYSAGVVDTAHQQDHPKAIKKHLGWWVYLRYRYRKFKEHRKEMATGNA